MGDIVDGTMFAQGWRAPFDKNKNGSSRSSILGRRGQQQDQGPSQSTCWFNERN